MTLLLPNLLIGATFPCAVAVSAHGAPQLGYDLGLVYAVNTLGAIVGTLLAGFLLIPAVGVHATIKVGIAINLLLAAILLVTATRRISVWRWVWLAAVPVAVVGVLFIPPWDQRVMSSGPAI